MAFKFKDKREEFLVSELLVTSISSGLQTRNKNFPIYNKENVPSEASKNLKNDLKEFLLLTMEQFPSCHENDHFSNIIKLSNNISEKHCKILHNGRFRIGISQKVINLFLKYIWTTGKIGMPFHCPFDSIIKVALLNGSSERYELKDWTGLDSIEEYKKYVNLAKIIASVKGLSIADWELYSWSRR